MKSCVFHINMRQALEAHEVSLLSLSLLTQGDAFDALPVQNRLDYLDEWTERSLTLDILRTHFSSKPKPLTQKVKRIP